ncbi:MAG: hypothetical protein ACI84K_000894 [Pseudohongiellaceae bacterium]|jgi:hypothetical protein
MNYSSVDDMRRYKTRFKAGVTSTFFILVIGLQSCQIVHFNSGEEMILNNDDFNGVELNSDIKNTCSPNMMGNNKFMGIVINVPSEVEFESGNNMEDDTFVRFPICGFYQLDMADLFEDSLVIIIAKNIDTGQTYRGEIIDKDPSPDVGLPFSEPKLSQDDLRGQLLAAYFNPNLLRYVDLPAEEARYNVLVQIGKYKSKVVSVKVVEKMQDFNHN